MSVPIVLLTDFGLKDHYVGSLKGVILTVDPKALIVDLAHDIAPQNILQGALLLEVSYAFFPKGSIFVCVVDPGVGTSRKILCVKTGNYYFLGPDNGLLSLALSHEKILETRSVENRRFFLRNTPSFTFHGRDIISPTAAHLAKKREIFSKIGPKINRIHSLQLPRVKKTKKKLLGEILYFDHFGNAITNIRRSDGSEEFWAQAEVAVGEIPLGKLRRTYGHGPRTLAALFNSSFQLEIAVLNGSAKVEGSLEVADTVILEIKK